MNYLKNFTLFLALCMSIVSCEKELAEKQILSQKELSKFDNSYKQANNLKNQQQQFNKKWTHSDVNIVNGMMSFKDENELTSFVHFLYETKDKNNWLFELERKTGFKSLSAHYIKQLDYLHETLEKNKGKEETLIYKFVEENKTYWRINDRDAENVELVQNYDFDKYYLVANNNLQFMVGEKLRGAAKTVDSDYVDYIYNDGSNKKMVSCGLPKAKVEIITTKNEKWCKNDRRVKLKARILSRNQQPTFIDVGYEIFLRGQKKASCVWVNYKTDLDVIDSSAELSVTMPSGDELTPFFGGALNIANFSGSNTYNIAGFDADFYIKPTGQTSNIEEPKFNEVKAKGTSRGMGGIWADMDCES